MASTPAPLPSLGLLDGLGTAGSGNTDSPAPLPHLGLLGGLGTAGAPVDDRQGAIEHPLPMAWHADPGFAAAYTWYALGVLVANRDEVAPPPPPPPPPSGGSGGAAFLPHIGLLLEANAPAPSPSPSVGGNKAGWYRPRRNYIVKGRRYFDLTEEELAQVIAQEYATRSDVRELVNDKPTRKLSRGDFARIAKQAQPEWDDDEEAAMLLL